MISNWDSKHLCNEIPPAVVIGCCGHALSVIRALADNDIPVIALESDPYLPGVRTKLAKVILVEDINGPKLLDALVDVRNDIDCVTNPVLFLTNDRMIKTIGQNLDIVRNRFFVSWMNCSESVMRLLDKESLECHSLEKNLNYPRTFYINGFDDVATAWQQIKQPIILKPAMPLASFKTFFPKSLDELLHFVSRRTGDLPLLAQHYIPGGDERIFFSALYLDNGNILARFDGRKLRSMPLGHTTVAESCVSEEVFTETSKFFEGLELSGPVSLELKRDKEGALWVIEPTVGRTDFWIGLCVENGVNLPLVEYCHQLNLDIPHQIQKDFAVWFNEERDPFGRMWLLLNREFGIRGRESRFIYLKHSDLMPMLSGLWQILLGMLKALSRRFLWLLSHVISRKSNGL
jgi:D-aspartate ligase